MKNIKINFALCVLVIGLFLTFSHAAQAATIAVNSLSDTQANDGGCTLREAIINANADNQTGSTDCTAGAGTDTINITTAGDIVLQTALPDLTTAMTINGLGAASTAVRRDAAALTEFRIFTKTAGTSTISNLTARDGIVRGTTGTTGGAGQGGSISNAGGALTLTNVTVTNNRAIGGIGTGGTGGQGNGGGISTTAALTLTNSLVSSNAATGGTGTTTGGQGNGGGIFLGNAGTLTSTNSVLSGNTATGGAGTTNGGLSQGGGLYAGFSNNIITFNGGRIVNNSSAGGGGTTSGSGGGIYANNIFLTLNISNSEISGNTAAIGSGGGIWSSGTMTVTNSTISGNSLTGNQSLGGGIFYNTNTLTLTNVTISNNSAATGGGISVTNGGTITLDNSIIANSPAGGDCARVSGTINASYSLIEQNLTCVNGTNTNNLTGDPNLGPLQNNGGTTQTHALLFGSIALDKGNSTLTTDQRGLTRPVDLANIPNALFENLAPTAGNGSDIGAVEMQIEPSAANVSIGGRVLTSDGRGLRNAVVYLTKANGETVSARTSAFGWYRFDNLEAGQTVVVAVSSKRFEFNPQVVTLADNITDLNFTAQNF